MGAPHGVSRRSAMRLAPSQSAEPSELRDSLKLLEVVCGLRLPEPTVLSSSIPLRATTPQPQPGKAMSLLKTQARLVKTLTSALGVVVSARTGIQRRMSLMAASSPPIRLVWRSSK
mmetsp:Transcript_49494/g.143939  ORF Transcript_49494/g.143939 Transcript_49494/m.143939 type:complete len:116 (-) Transcript_49494:70-417(-)